MADYPGAIKEFTTKIDKNAGGVSVGPEYFNVPGSGPYQIYLDHIPKDSATTSIGASGGATWSEVFVAPAATHQYMVDYTTGKITFYSANSGEAVQAVYKNLGDDIMAEHVNMLQDEMVAVETELGINPKGSYASVKARLDAIVSSVAASGINGDNIVDNTVRAGALKNDIKGANWVSYGRPTLSSIVDHENQAIAAHAATAVSVNPPGTMTSTSVQQHVDAKGSAPQTNSNPHGMSLSDLGGTYSPSNIDSAGRVTAVTYMSSRGYILAGTYISAQTVVASGNSIYINTQDSSLSPVDGDSAIYFYNAGSVTGSRFGWNDSAARFEINQPVIVFGDVTASGNMSPEASGARSVGSPAVPFGTGCFDVVKSEAGGYTIGNSSGATGKFTTTDGKTVTVKGGIIVSIV